MIVENRIGYGRCSARADRRRSPAHRARSPTTRRLWTMQERIAGYRLALAEAGIAEDPAAGHASTAPTRQCQPEGRSPRCSPSVRPADGDLRGAQRDGARSRFGRCAPPHSSCRSSSSTSRATPDLLVTPPLVIQSDPDAARPGRRRDGARTSRRPRTRRARLVVHQSDASTSHRRSRDEHGAPRQADPDRG